MSAQAPAERDAKRPRVGVVKLTSCDGCQLTLLDLEDELLGLAARLDLVEFAEATSRRSSGPYDVLLVEGSISTPDQAQEIIRLRRESSLLVTIGACATSGGIQALRNLEAGDTPFGAGIYPRLELISSLATSTPVSDHVAVDAQLFGCPIAPGQLLELLTALLVGRRPQLPEESVCAECKRRGIACVLVTRQLPCLGPVTRTGCGALCPAFARACYGCFGPTDAANTPALARQFRDQGRSEAEVARLFAGVNVNAPAFREIAEGQAGR